MSMAAQVNTMELRDCDDDLARRFASGDGQAFDRLVALYQPRVARLAFRLLGWNGDVDDIVQDVFLKAYEKSRGFRGDASLWTWLTTITVNGCRSRMRRAALFRRFRLGLSAGGSHGPPADVGAVRDETSQRVRSAVSSLPTKDREVVVLYYLEQRSTADLSTLLGISTNAIDVRLHRARQKLKTLLADLGPEYEP